MIMKHLHIHIETAQILIQSPVYSTSLYISMLLDQFTMKDSMDVFRRDAIISIVLYV